MQPLNLPTYLFNTKSVNNRKYIFDSIRRKYILLTPEEWVRQNFICYLTSEKKVPASLISLETGLRLHKTLKRTDILIYDRKGKVCTIVECKAANIQLTQGVFEQILRYNLAYSVPYIIITNGLHHYCCKLNYETSGYVFLPEIPEYDMMSM